MSLYSRRLLLRSSHCVAEVYSLHSSQFCIIDRTSFSGVGITYIVSLYAHRSYGIHLVGTAYVSSIFFMCEHKFSTAFIVSYLAGPADVCLPIVKVVVWYCLMTAIPQRCPYPYPYIRLSIYLFLKKTQTLFFPPFQTGFFAKIPFFLPDPETISLSTQTTQTTLLQSHNKGIMSAPQETEEAPPSWNNHQPDRYEELLAEHVGATKTRFAVYLKAPGVGLDVFPSPPSHFRLRVKFLVTGNEDDEACDSDDETPLPEDVTPLKHAGWHNRAPHVVEDYPMASEPINAVMPKTISYLSNIRPLRNRLRGVQYLSTMKGDLLITLIYEKRALGEVWQRHAAMLRECVGTDLVAQSKGVERLVGGRNYVTEELGFPEGPRLRYRQIAGNFSNPNGKMAEHTLAWLASCFSEEKKRGIDLLELYCGCGNHTMAMSRVFRRVLSVEINRKLVGAAHLNLTLNNATNAWVMRAPSENFCSAMLRHEVWKLKLSKYYKDSVPTGADAVEGMDSFVEAQKQGLTEAERAADEAIFKFGAVIVDPPRAGLDAVTCKLVSRYAKIAYISCNPEALERDLNILSETHTIQRMAVFDHFPYTGHLECGAMLVRKESEDNKEPKTKDEDAEDTEKKGEKEEEEKKEGESS